MSFGPGFAALSICALLTSNAAVAPDEVDPSSPDADAEDLGAIDDGPDVAPDTNAPAERDEGVEYVDEDGEVEAEPDDGVEYVDDEDGEVEAEPDEPDAPIRPPRVDGPYVGAVAIGTASFASVLDLDTPNPLLGGGAFVQAGDAVFPWMSIGVAIGGHAAAFADQRMWSAALLVEFGFVPAKRYPLSIRAGFGFGGGRVTDQVTGLRPGFGGAMFKGSLRYEFFPLAAKNRPDRGGGWAIGPELGWLGATPAAKGQPFVNTILIGLSSSFFFGS